jgi:hypothetical protein
VSGRVAIQPLPRILRPLVRELLLAFEPMRAALDFRTMYFAVRVRADEVAGVKHGSDGEVSRSRSGGIRSHYFHSHYFRGQDPDGRQTGLSRLIETFAMMVERLRQATPYDISAVEFLFHWSPGGERPARPERPRDRRAS